MNNLARLATRQSSHHALSKAASPTNTLPSSYTRLATYRRISSTRVLPDGALRTTQAPVLQLRSAFGAGSIGISNKNNFTTSSSRPAKTNTPPSPPPQKDTTTNSAAPPEKEVPKAAAAGADASSDTVAKEAEGKTSEEAKETKDSESASDNKESESESQKEDGGDKKKKTDAPPPPPHGNMTPWQVFMETMTGEFKKSQEWQDSTKAIASSANSFVESEGVRRAREKYESTTGVVSNVATTAAKTTATALGKGASWTWDTSVVKGVRKVANVTGDAVEKATRPIRETETYKDISNTLDDGGSARYGGWVEKEERRKKRQAQLDQMKREGKSTEVAQEDPDAGTNITLHKDAAWKESWRDFRDQNKYMQGLLNMRKGYDESENPLVSTARGITDAIGGFFAENENAQVIKQIRTMDPGFKMEPFLDDLRDYILPEVLDAYVKGDIETLKMWLSAAQFNVYEALSKQYSKVGLKSDGRILDIRGVDIVKSRLLDPGDIPVFIVTCRTQEVHVYRNAKSGALAAGMEDRVQLVSYVIGMTRVPEDVNNPETRGWRLIEMQKSGKDWL